MHWNEIIDHDPDRGEYLIQQIKSINDRLDKVREELMLNIEQSKAILDMITKNESIGQQQLDETTKELRKQLAESLTIDPSSGLLIHAERLQNENS